MLRVLSFLLSIITLVINLVKEFEVPGFGAEKRQAVLDSVGLAYDTVLSVAKVKISKEKVLEFASAAIEIVVGLYNMTGVFKKESIPERSF
jgi:hypothetical protein